MRKKRSFLIIIVIFLLGFICPPLPSVVGENDGHSNPGTDGGGGGGSCSDPCFHSAVGFRLTVVDKRTGKRCKYNENTNEICTSATGAGVVESKSIDIRFDYNVNDSSLYNHNCWTVSGRRTKQELLEKNVLRNPDASDFVYCGTTKYHNDNMHKLSDFDFPPANSTKYPKKWGSVSGMATEHYPGNIEAIRRWLMCKQGDSSATWCQKNTGDGTGYPSADIKRSNAFFNKLYNNLFYIKQTGTNKGKLVDDGPIDVALVKNLDNAYLQFEQLTSVTSRTGGGVGAAYHSGAMGTVAEVAYVALNKSISVAPHTWQSLSKGVFFKVWFANPNDGTNGLGSLTYLKNLNDLNNKETLAAFLQKDTANIMNFWVQSGLVCGTSLIDALKNNKKTAYNKLKEIHASDITTGFLANYTYKEAKFFYDNMTAAEKNALSCDYVLPCARVARIIYDNCAASGCKISEDDTQKITYEQAMQRYTGINQDKLTDYSTTDLSLNKPISQSLWSRGWLRAYNNVYRTPGTPANSITKFPNSCADVSCDKNFVTALYNKNASNLSNADYVGFMDWYYKATGGKYALLLTDSWQEMGNSGPSCDEIANCPAPEDKPECSDTSFTLEDYKYGLDNNDSKNCWLKGVAYTNGGLKTSKVQTLSSSGCYLYCSEKAEFSNLPSSPSSSVRAGQIFKWGMDPDDKSNSAFGTMKLSRACKVSGTACKNISFSYSSSDWDNSSIGGQSSVVTTNVKLTYEDPSNKYHISDAMLNAYHTSGSGSMSGKCKNNSCTQLCANARCDEGVPNGIVEISNSYEFRYPEASLKWYSNKVDGSVVSKSAVESTNTAYYYEIGYGLPTYFVTPNGEYGGTSSDGYAGELTAKIESIGTKGHFDNLARMMDGISYSCQFKLINELFGDECVYDATGALTSGSPDYCDPNGGDGTPVGTPKNIDVVFRTVDLINNSGDIDQGLDYAFPGRAGRIDGTSRSIGYNWWGRYTNLSDEEKKHNIATILNDQVYNVTNPQFTIELTTSKINDIRDFNENARSSGKDPFSELEKLTNEDSPGGGFTGYVCIEDSSSGAKFCASRFLTKLIADYGLRGRCVFGSTTVDRANQHFSHSADCG